MMHFRMRAKNGELIEAKTRGQRRLQYPMPIVTTYQNPRERVLFDAVRDANPYFHHDNSIWPTVTAAGDRVWTLSFTVRKTANTYDAKRRSATVSDQTFQIVLKGDHDGTGANTYTTGTIDIDRMNFLDAVDQMNREGLTMAEVTYDIIKPSTTDNDVDLTWSTV
jgi:hypothetical protein